MDITNTMGKDWDWWGDDERVLYIYNKFCIISSQMSIWTSDNSLEQTIEGAPKLSPVLLSVINYGLAWRNTKKHMLLVISLLGKPYWFAHWGSFARGCSAYHLAVGEFNSQASEGDSL